MKNELNKMNHYLVQENYFARMLFPVSHKGLEQAITFASRANVNVQFVNVENGSKEIVWTPEK